MSLIQNSLVQMEEKVDDDLKVQRATLEAIELLKARIPRLLHDFGLDGRLRRSENQIRADIQAMLVLLDIFQEEPQLLDPHLKIILPPLVERLVYLIHLGGFDLKESTNERQLYGIAEILYTLCKVRGEKVVARFLDSEPRHILPVINALQFYSGQILDAPVPSASVSSDSIAIEQRNSLGSDDGDWKLRYTLLLWAGQLVLTPFDLSSICEGTEIFQFEDGDRSFQKLPKIAKYILEIALMFSGSPTKEQSSAASMLVKLVLRPDMLKTKTLDSLVSWCLTLLPMGNDGQASLYKQTFVLRVLHGLVQSADVHDICHQFPPIFQISVQLFGGEQEIFSSAQKSAVTRKLAIKLLRSVTVQTLQLDNTDSEYLRAIYEKMMQQVGALEETIDFLLKSLMDPDTQVRYAASKALSIITVKLDKDTGEEVVEAIIGSLGEDVLGDGQSKTFSSVNPLRWHGLTLTLSHMLFRRSPSPGQLQAILNALYLTLTFEQRSATGNSLGTNVRDASNFGLWSLARRYKFNELLDLSPALSETGSNELVTSMLQNTANNLLASACLDPSGNVRRGSSAALQELIGRHPDEVKDGIALVQIVDYQAVGLRRRAMVDVAVEAAKLDNMYLTKLVDGLFGWRGLQAPDMISRNFSAFSVAKLTTALPKVKFDAYMDRIVSELKSCAAGDLERRHGLIKALSESVSQQESALRDMGQSRDHTLQKSSSESGGVSKVQVLWILFEDVLDLSQQNINLTSVRSGLTTEPTVSLISALSSFNLSYNNTLNGAVFEDGLFRSIRAAQKILSLCLSTTDGPTLEVIPRACENMCSLLPPQNRTELIKSWMLGLEPMSKTNRISGQMLAVASSWNTLNVGIQEGSILNGIGQLKEEILNTLIIIFEEGDVDARVMAIRCLKMVVDATAFDDRKETVDSKLLHAFLAGLNDYTTNERGDVGSLVRLESIDAMRHVWSARPDVVGEANTKCHLAVQRLALERLDKVRLHASQCLHAGEVGMAQKTISDVSTSEYFLASALSLLTQSPSPAERAWPDSTRTIPNTDRLLALVQGFASSVGGGPDSLMTVARRALFALCDALPTYPLHPPNPDGPTGYCLVDVANALLSALRTNQDQPTNDRVLIPLLDTTAFLFDAGILPRLSQAHASTTFPFRTLLSLVQKAHFKSGVLPKLLPAIHIYRHLAAAVPAARAGALRKLTGMLAHPFPSVRVAVADAVWIVLATDADVDAGSGAVVGGEREKEEKMVRNSLRKRDWRVVSAGEGKAVANELTRLWGV